MQLAKAQSDERLRQMSIAEVRTGWQEGKGAVGPALRLHLASCLDRISYARMCLHKAALRNINKASLNYDWAVENPMNDHREMISKTYNKSEKEALRPEFPQGEGSRDFVPKTNWGYGNIDPDLIKRHKELTDRQYFMGPHWRGKPKPLIYEDLSFEGQVAAHFTPPTKTPVKPKKRY